MCVCMRFPFVFPIEELFLVFSLMSLPSLGWRFHSSILCRDGFMAHRDLTCLSQMATKGLQGWGTGPRIVFSCIIYDLFVSSLKAFIIFIRLDLDLRSSSSTSALLGYSGFPVEG